MRPVILLVNALPLTSLYLKLPNFCLPIGFPIHATGLSRP